MKCYAVELRLPAKPKRRASVARGWRRDSVKSPATTGRQEQSGHEVIFLAMDRLELGGGPAVDENAACVRDGREHCLRKRLAVACDPGYDGRGHNEVSPGPTRIDHGKTGGFDSCTPVATSRSGTTPCWIHDQAP